MGALMKRGDCVEEAFTFRKTDPSAFFFFFFASRIHFKNDQVVLITLLRRAFCIVSGCI